MAQLPSSVEKAYGLLLLLAASCRNTHPHTQDQNDPFLPSRHVYKRPATHTATLDEVFSFATWNVFEGRNRQVLSGIQELLEDYSVTALALQEVPFDLLQNPKLQQYHIAYLPDNHTNAKPNGTYDRSFGNAIVSPHALTSVSGVDLPIVSWDYWGKSNPIRRSAIGARIAHDVDVWCTHLDLYCRPSERVAQCAPVLEKISSCGARTTFLGMDANNLLEPFMDEPLLEVLRNNGFRDPWGEERREYPSYIDHALARGAKPLHGKVLALPGSDHNALLASYRLLTH